MLDAWWKAHSPYCVALQFLAVCRDTGNAAIITMNIFCLGDFSSGFTLDNVKKVDNRYVSAELFDLAQERFFTRKMGIPMGTDLFEVPPNAL